MVPSDKRGDMSVLIDTSVFWFIGFVFVVIRIYSRTRLTKHLDVDDFWMMAAEFTATVNQSLIWVWSQHGLGLHNTHVSQDDILLGMKFKYVTTPLYILTLNFVKFSILTFYRRLFPYERFHKACNVMIPFVAVYAIVFVSLALGNCVPVQYQWSLDKDAVSKHCVSAINIQYARTSLGTLTDFVILLLPIKYLWKLSLDRKLRVGVIILFSVGGFACVASLYRLGMLHSYYESRDGSYTNGALARLSNIEFNLAIVTASAPAVKVFVDQFIPARWKSQISGGSHSNSDETSPNDIVFSARDMRLMSADDMSLKDVGGTLLNDDKRPPHTEAEIV